MASKMTKRAALLDKPFCSIGNCAVHKGMPENGNPYRGNSLMGDERVAALEAFRDGGDTSEYTFWYAPAGGGARQLLDPKCVMWEGMRRRK